MRCTWTMPPTTSAPAARSPRPKCGSTAPIDTSRKPRRYTGEGDVDRLSMRRFGEGLDVGWLKDPRFGGTVRGHFRVDASGSDAATLALTGGGQLRRAEMFRGTLSDANVSIEIEQGTLRASYDGRFEHIDPSVPFAPAANHSEPVSTTGGPPSDGDGDPRLPSDPRLRAWLTGTGRVAATIRNPLTSEATTLADYDV